MVRGRWAQDGHTRTHTHIPILPFCQQTLTRQCSFNLGTQNSCFDSATKTNPQTCLLAYPPDISNVSLKLGSTSLSLSHPDPLFCPHSCTLYLVHSAADFSHVRALCASSSWQSHPSHTLPHYPDLLCAHSANTLLLAHSSQCPLSLPRSFLASWTDVGSFR